MDVIRLLKSKNRCLEQFLEVSGEFLAQVETGDFSEVETFYKKRDRILKGFDLYDRKLTECIEALPASANTPAITPEQSREAEQALTIKDVLIRNIADVDARIIETLEAEKARIMREMAQTQKSSVAVKKFKSSWVAGSGEDLDKKL